MAVPPSGWRQLVSNQHDHSESTLHGTVLGRLLRVGSVGESVPSACEDGL